MKKLSRCGVYVFLVLALSVPIMAQSRGGGSGQRGTPGGVPSAPSTSPGVSAVSATPVVTSTPSTSRDYSGIGSYHTGGVPYSGGHGGSYYVPNLQYSSFNSAYSYYQCQDFFFWLQSHYYMNRSYFGRFYRQREPIITPELLKVTMRQPLKLSLQMLNSVDELETMLKEGEAGKPVDKAAVAAKTQEIRDLAKKIRSDEALAFFDQRRDKDALKLDDAGSLGLDAIARLREVATDLNTQLKNMYNEDKTSTVSVQSLAAPSFESLTKGIDKLAKAIENSARRL